MNVARLLLIAASAVVLAAVSLLAIPILLALSIHDRCPLRQRPPL